MTGAADAPRLGFFGKLPARGDFVTRRLSPDFTQAWDGWLQDAMAMSAQQLAGDWLDTYLTAPIWRFLLAPELCGPAPMMGVVMPSVDRVGRYFPLTLALPLPEAHARVRTMLGAGEWFDTVEQLALSALEDDADLDRIDEQAEAIGPPEANGTARGWHRVERAVSVDVAAGDGPDAAVEMLDGVLALVAGRYSLWWTSGSEQIRPSLMMAEGLPPVERFAALLDGRWEQWGWKTR